MNNSEKERFVSFNSDQLKILTAKQNELLNVIAEDLELDIKTDTKGVLLNGLNSSVDIAAELLEQLSELLVKDKHVTTGDIRRAIKTLSSDRNTNLKKLFSSPLELKGKRKAVYPKTAQQKAYLEAAQQSDLVFGVGPAGTGKTYLAMAMAVSALLEKKVKKIILTRPAVEAGERLGFLPGDLTEKVNPYLRPLYDALYDFAGYDQAIQWIEKEVIEVAPLAFMRGRTLSNSFVILDEAQNTNTGQMKMILTRLGEGSKCLITGDITQIDLPRGQESGLKQALNVLKNSPMIKVVKFTETDVIRHPLVAEIIKAYDNYSDHTETEQSA